MGKFIRKNIGLRLLVCGITMSVSLFFLGAGASQINEKRRDRTETRKNEIGKWQAILQKFGEDLPDGQRAEWMKMASRNPEKMLKIASHYRR